MTTFIDGLSLGSIYALIALGYTMVYGIAKMLNFAHGDVIMVGAYAVLSTLTLTGHPILGVVVAVVICTVLGVVMEKVAYKPLRGASPLAVLITAIGVSYLLQSIAQLVFGSKSRAISLGNFGAVKIGSVEINMATIITLAVAAVIMLVLQLFVKYTKTGRAMIAVSEDRGAAALMGINVNRIIAITFVIGSILAGAGGVLYATAYPQVDPNMGYIPGLKAFVAAVLGGIGSIPGAMAGGIILGIAETLTKGYLSSQYADAISYIILIVILLVKPAGLFGKKTTVKV